MASELEAPKLMALDELNVYWSATSTAAPSTESLWKADKLGAAAPLRIVGAVAPVAALSAHAGNVYWVDSASGKIFTLASGATAPAELIAAPGRARFLTASARGLFFIDLEQGAVKKANFDGSAVTTLATGQLGPAHLRLDESHAYWMNIEGAKLPAYSVMRVPLEGGDPVSVMGEHAYGSGFALDATHVFVSTTDRLLQVSKSGEGLKVVMSMQTIGAPAADANGVYWAGPGAVSGGASLRRMNKVTLEVTTLAQPSQQVVALAADATGVYWLAKGQAAADGVLTRACE